MVRPDREPLRARVGADETYVGGPKPGRPGRGAGGKTPRGGRGPHASRLVAGAVESGRGLSRGRRLGDAGHARMRVAGKRRRQLFCWRAGAGIV